MGENCFKNLRQFCTQNGCILQTKLTSIGRALLFAFIVQIVFGSILVLDTLLLDETFGIIVGIFRLSPPVPPRFGV